MEQNQIDSAKRDGRKENAKVTQAALRAAGRKLFGQMGYKATSVGNLCAEAGVTAGALYHHFGDKKGLFAAVAEDLECGMVQLGAQAHLALLDQGGTGWDGFIASIDAILTAGIDPEVRLIGLTDAPAVLGADGWMEIRERHGLGVIAGVIQGLQAGGILEAGDPKRLARLVLGLIYGAVQALPVDAASIDAALADTKRLVHAMLGGLRRNGALPIIEN